MDTDFEKKLETEKEPIINAYSEKSHEGEFNKTENQELEDPGYIEDIRQKMNNLSVSSSQRALSKRFMNDIELQEQRAQEVWMPILKNSRHKNIEDEYRKISPQRLVFFDVLDQNRFVEQTRINFEELQSRYHIDLVQRWDEFEIDKMFGKGLNPTSLITSLQSAEWFEKNLSSRQNTTVIEMGTGAGWGTVMLFNTLKERNPDQKIRQFSVDMSAHSIAATETLLNYSGVSYITVADGEELEKVERWLQEEGQEFSGVILVLDQFNDVVNRFQENSIDGIYSSHGTAYLSKNEYTDLMQKSSKVLKNGGLFIADSLNPLYTNKLDPIFTLRQIIDPVGMKKMLDRRNIQYVYGKEKIKNNSKYFPNQDVQILKGFNTEEAYLILRWCNHLLKSLDISRLVKTVKSLSVTMKVVDDYRADVFPSFLLDEIVEENHMNYKKLDGRPDFPIFMDTQGFRLNKS